MALNTQRHRKPISDEPNKFLVECLDIINPKPGILALDLPCGFGRHSRLLAAHGVSVVAADLHMASLKASKSMAIHSVALDASHGMPFRPDVFDLIVVVDYSQEGLISFIKSNLSRNGFIIYSTYQGRGGNWVGLPRRSSFLQEISDGFESIILRLKDVGPGKEERVSVCFLGKRV